ncbi:MAG: acetyl-CoA carboxylase biotin carboxyl carrier protein [Candidatus Omnitrophica bacterium]|nr:acetyl-CoA carboxylase biotin carboxyl carrier protein [Candidatus Omnitrophota bacterium]
MNLKELKELLSLMNENDLVEVELEREGMKIRLRKAGAGGNQSIVVEHTALAQPPSSVPGSAPAQPKPAGLEIKSPMVGTFYRAPAPEAPPFVEVGQMIEVGQVLCIIEAMKLMNEIKSEVKGRVVQILVENAQPIEFGQVLFLVETD